MAPRRYSRHTFAVAEIDANGNTVLNERVPFRFRPYRDNRQHTVRDGDTLFALAGLYFKPLPRPCGLWWVIADFQPTPIYDATLRLDPGRVLIIPSVRAVTEELFSERRRLESLV